MCFRPYMVEPLIRKIVPSFIRGEECDILICIQSLSPHCTLSYHTALFINSANIHNAMGMFTPLRASQNLGFYRVVAVCHATRGAAGGRFSPPNVLGSLTISLVLTFHLGI